jgi:hypothetical protein
MSEQDVRDGQPIFDRIGTALDRIGSFDTRVQVGLAGYARQRRGVLRGLKDDVPGRITGRHIADELIGFAEACEALADVLDDERARRADTMRHPDPAYEGQIADEL